MPAGVDRPRRRASQPTEPLRPPTPSRRRSKTPVDQHRIFARTLLDLLTNSRLRLETASLEAGGKLPAKIADKLASYDCVVVVGDAPGLDLAGDQKSRAGGRSTPATTRSHPAPEQQTAWQSNPAERRGRLYGRRADRL